MFYRLEYYLDMTMEPDQFYIVGNNLALDFINTAHHDLGAEVLASWGTAVGLVEPSAAGYVAQRWVDTDLKKVVAFRDHLRDVVAKLVISKNVTNKDIEWINAILREKAGYTELVMTPEGFAKQNKIELKRALDVRVPIVEAFVDLITFGNLDYIRKCERPDCILYFYDTTKNHRRRWCSMSICGNRAKVAKFYEKQRSKASSKS